MKTMKNSISMLAALLISGSIFATGNLKVNFTGAKPELTVIEISNLKTSSFEISVKDESGDVIFSKETQPLTNYKRNFDFSKLEEGTYYLTVRVENEIHETEFEVKKGKINLLQEKKIVEPYFTFANNELKMTYLNFPSEKSSFHLYDLQGNELYLKNFGTEFNIQHGISLARLPKGSYNAVLSTEEDSYNYTVTKE